MGKLSRRSLLLALPGASALYTLAQSRGGLMPSGQTRKPAPGARRSSIVVVGAGAFGGWTALALLRRGARVTLLDAWGPGNSRASSGGETRVIRAVYGSDGIYVGMVARAFELWRENEKRWKRRLFRRTGALWMVAGPGDYVRSSIPLLREKGFTFEEMSTAEASKRYPQIRFEGLDWALYEKEAGYLLARQACAQVLEGFLAEGGSYREATASAGQIAGGRMKSLRISDATELFADAYVFACGPWLGKLFPEVLGGFLEPTRQEVFYFGTPAGDPRFD
ncbi:MAG TPA: FAD-dependent oxidoreductase, partial [Thermoanaerobaculia bacterium]|nr:FAD-dependent oxidoreductase [Thermoanaerobaculia bacterium]